MHGEHVLGGLVALSLFKKATAYGLARYYGFPRLYRKLIRLNRRLMIEPVGGSAEKKFNENVKTMFRWPNRAAQGMKGMWRKFGTGRVDTPKV